jgi:hypothetical protein
MDNLEILESKLNVLSNKISNISQDLTNDEIKPFFIDSVNHFCDMMELIAKEKVKNEDTSFKGYQNYLDKMNFELTRLCEVTGISLEKIRKLISGQIGRK